MPRHSVGSSQSSTIRPQPATYGGAHLRRVFTDATASDATADDLDGAGRVVGNVLTSGGKHIVALCTKLSLMFGGGPNKPLRTLLKTLHCLRCAKPYFDPKAILPPRDAPADFVLRELFVRSRSCAFCGATRGFTMPSVKKASKAGKAFRSILNGLNCSSQYSALLYITALATLLPDLPAVFMKYGTTRAIHVLRSRVTEQPNGDDDFLLAPSHCALAVLGEVEIHSIGKEIVALTERINDVETWKPAQGLVRNRAELYWKLVPFWRSPQTAILIAIIIRAGVTGNEVDFTPVVDHHWHIHEFYKEQWAERFQIDFDSLGQHLAHAEDPVLNSMLPALLFAIRESIIAEYRLRVRHDISQGREPRQTERTLHMLQSPDWETLLRSWLGLIDEDDGDFMESALERWWDVYVDEPAESSELVALKDNVKNMCISLHQQIRVTEALTALTNSCLSCYPPPRVHCLRKNQAHDVASSLFPKSRRARRRRAIPPRSFFPQVNRVDRDVCAAPIS